MTTQGIGRREGPVLSPRHGLKFHVISRASTARIVLRKRSNTRHTLLFVWVSVGMLPLLFQIKSYWKFVSPHKLTETLVTPVNAVKETIDLAAICPVEGLFIAGAWWNLAVTHYFSLEQSHICHFVIPQYNIHGSYVLGEKRGPSSSTTPPSCADDSFPFDYYFYHGSISYYAFYEEGAGTYCTIDKTAYVRVRVLGTFDSNGSALAKDRGDTEYRYSLWYSFLGFMWMVYRVFLLRKSYVSCKYYGQKFNKLGETLSRKAAAVYMQESVRLVPHNATNYFRIVVLYMLIEGVMSDLFLLIAQDGLFAKTQYISLGYNLSGVVSMIFEMLESMKCLREKSLTKHAWWENSSVPQS
ncbi:hypothetical protein DVH05_004157 [Phytophthora capsici]|nr:hypothetical protein DVH05_004157 [Phytophthora capsici]